MIDETGSKYNPGEAQLVASEVDELIDNGVSSSDIGVITPYNAQIKILDDALRGACIDEAASVDIDTIDSFQRSEKEGILVSFVRNNDANNNGLFTKPDEGERRLTGALICTKKRMVLIKEFETLGIVVDRVNAEDSCVKV